MLSNNYRLKPEKERRKEGRKKGRKERKVDGFLEYFSHFKVRVNQKFP